MVNKPKMPETQETQVPTKKPSELDQSKKTPMVKPMPEEEIPYLAPSSLPIQK